MRVSKYAAVLVTIAALTVFQFLAMGEYSDNNTWFYNDPLDNRTIVIDPGHGGIDGGASLGEHFHEKDINLAVSLKLRELLTAAGANVILTRDRDISLENKSDLQSSRYRRDLDARRDIVNNSKADIFVSIHSNCFRADPKSKGAIVFYHSESEEGKKLALSVAGSIDSIVYKDYLKSDSLKSKVLPESLFILRASRVPGILLETGYMTNQEEGRLLRQDDFQSVMAEAVLEGLRKYFTYSAASPVL